MASNLDNCLGCIRPPCKIHDKNSPSSSQKKILSETSKNYRLKLRGMIRKIENVNKQHESTIKEQYVVLSSTHVSKRRRRVLSFKPFGFKKIISPQSSKKYRLKYGRKTRNLSVIASPKPQSHNSIDEQHDSTIEDYDDIPSTSSASKGKRRILRDSPNYSSQLENNDDVTSTSNALKGRESIVLDLPKNLSQVTIEDYDESQNSSQENQPTDNVQRQKEIFKVSINPSPQPKPESTTPPMPETAALRPPEPIRPPAPLRPPGPWRPPIPIRPPAPPRPPGALMPPTQAAAWPSRSVIIRMPSPMATPTLPNSIEPTPTPKSSQLAIAHVSNQHVQNSFRAANPSDQESGEISHQIRTNSVRTHTPIMIFNRDQANAIREAERIDYLRRQSRARQGQLNSSPELTELFVLKADPVSPLQNTAQALKEEERESLNNATEDFPQTHHPTLVSNRVYQNPRTSIDDHTRMETNVFEEHNYSHKPFHGPHQLLSTASGGSNKNYSQRSSDSEYIPDRCMPQQNYYQRSSNIEAPSERYMPMVSDDGHNHQAVVGNYPAPYQQSSPVSIESNHNYPQSSSSEESIAEENSMLQQNCSEATSERYMPPMGSGGGPNHQEIVGNYPAPNQRSSQIGCDNCFQMLSRLEAAIESYTSSMISIGEPFTAPSQHSSTASRGPYHNYSQRSLNIEATSGMCMPPMDSGSGSSSTDLNLARYRSYLRPVPYQNTSQHPYIPTSQQQTPLQESFTYNIYNRDQTFGTQNDPRRYWNPSRQSSFRAIADPSLTQEPMQALLPAITNQQHQFFPDGNFNSSNYLLLLQDLLMDRFPFLQQ